MRGFPSAVTSGGPGSFFGSDVTEPTPTLSSTSCLTPVTLETSEAGAFWRPLMWPTLFDLFEPPANTNTSAPPTTITAAAIIQAV